MRRETEAETDVRLTGLIPRLTSPSRHNGQLVDIWFGVERRHRTAEWDAAFARVAEGWRPDPRNASYFSLFSHPSSAALIVARQVGSDPETWREVELEGHALVARVNRAVAEQRVEGATQVRSSSRRPVRVPGAASELSVLGWLTEAAQAIRGLTPKPTLTVTQSSTTGVR